MATAYDLEFIYNIRDNGVREDGRRSFLRQWETVDFINRGAYGEVYLIRRGSELCAVKIIDMDKPNVDFSVEIEALRAVQGRKHAPKIYEYEIVGVDNGRYVRRYQNIRMELLSELPKAMTEDDVIEMGIQLCDILGVCHSGEKKIIHCDIKPENILVSRRGGYILTDFGASTITERTHSSSGHAGTPLYMAPEINAFKPYDGRSDLYSLGVTMYALLNNGYPPFYDGKNGSDAIRMRLEGKKIPAINGVSAGMMKILRRLMQTEPDRRYRSANELSRDLYALAEYRRRQYEAEEEAIRREEEKKAAREAAEAAKQRAEKQAAGDRIQNDVYGQTDVYGRGAVRPVPGSKRRPLGMIAAAAALVAAIVLGVVFIPGLSKKDEKTGSQQPGAVSGAISKTDINITVEMSGVTESDINTVNEIPYLTDVTSVSVGDHVLFGSYPQTADGEVQPIEWRVLDFEDGNALMITEYLLDRKPYNETDESVTWETCTLRKWLNSDFYDTAFDENERKKIVLKHNTNPENPSYYTKGGNDTDDHVFCLSINEALKYFSNNEDRRAKITAYFTGWWWLRSPGSSSSSAACIYYDGDIGDYISGDVSRGDGCVRPVVLASLSAES